MPLDDFLPDFDFNEIHSTRVAAPPERGAGRGARVTSREVPLLVALMALRGCRQPSAAAAAPAGSRSTRRSSTSSRAPASCCSPTDRTSSSFGGVGRFWTADGG